MTVGNALSLPYPDNSFDMALLMGPLYHLQEKSERIKAIQEAKRVLKPSGFLFCAAVSRFASMLDGFVSNLFADPVFHKIVDRDLHDGHHYNLSQAQDYFTTAYLHKPDELLQEIQEGALRCHKLIGVEGPLGIFPELNTWLDDNDIFKISLALQYMKRVEEEKSLLGVSFHLLGIAEKVHI